MARSAAETRQRIVDAAYGEFWRHGFVRASLDDIAERACITKRTLYQHFPSKDDLVSEVLACSHTLASERLQRISERLPRERDAMIDMLFDELAAWAGQPRWPGAGFTRAVSELADLPGHPARQIARQHKAATETWLTDLLGGANVMTPQVRAREIVLLIEGAMSLILIHGDCSYAKAAANAAKQLVNGRLQ